MAALQAGSVNVIVVNAGHAAPQAAAPPDRKLGPLRPECLYTTGPAWHDPASDVMHGQPEPCTREGNGYMQHDPAQELLQIARIATTRWTRTV